MHQCTKQKFEAGDDFNESNTNKWFKATDLYKKHSVDDEQSQ